MTTPNAEQITLWNERSGPRWVATQRSLDLQLTPFGRVPMERLALRPGQRVLDVGCGCGATTLDLAAAVGPGGRVTGIDVSSVMLARARERAAELAHVDFVQADAQTHAFADRYDALYSRFGVMFFDDPQGAFTRLRAALTEGAPVAFVSWRAPELNPWLTVPLAAALPLLPEPPKMAPPDAPGPFGFANEARVRAILESAGFRDVRADPLDLPMHLAGAGLDEALEVSLQVGPCGQIVRENPHLADPLREAIRDAFIPHLTPEGVVLGAAAWVYTARA